MHQISDENFERKIKDRYNLISTSLFRFLKK